MVEYNLEDVRTFENGRITPIIYSVRTVRGDSDDPSRHSSDRLIATLKLVALRTSRTWFFCLLGV